MRAVRTSCLDLAILRDLEPFRNQRVLGVETQPANRVPRAPRSRSKIPANFWSTFEAEVPNERL